MNIQPEIRAIAFLKLEEILESEYQTLSSSPSSKDDSIIEQLEKIILLLKNSETSPICLSHKDRRTSLNPDHAA